MKKLLFSWAILFSINVAGQDKVVQKYGEMISEEALKENLSIIASDAMEGRETGSRGQKMAAAFIEAHFEEIGLIPPVKGSYFQPVELYAQRKGEAYLKIGQEQFNNYNGIVYDGNYDSKGEVNAELVFIGKGREEDYSQLDVKDKAVLLFSDLAGSYNRAEVRRAQSKGAGLVLLCNTSTDEDFKQLAEQTKVFSGERLSLTKPTPETAGRGMLLISPTIAAKLTGYSYSKLKVIADGGSGKSAFKKIKPSSIRYKTSVQVKAVKTNNVLGFLEGTDKKDEVIVITAHYDHIGVNEGKTGDLINNGADDDGSGTVAVMELAKVFAQAKDEGNGPRRSILFMTVTGEEFGLLGSSYYTTNPVFPLEKTVVNLNIDMVGRRDPAHKSSAPYVYVIGSDKLSTELHKLSERVNRTYTNLIFDYTYNDTNHPDRLYYRSDHWNFAKNNIPVIFYFDGIHEDYHQPSDEVDKIEFDLLKKRTQCVFYTAWEIANREQRIVPDKK